MSRMTPKRREMLAAAARDAQALRVDWRESVAHHQMRIEAQFHELAARLAVRASGWAAKGLPSAKQAKEIHDRLASARVKPGKGRAKDMRRVEKALQDALRDLPSEE